MGHRGDRYVRNNYDEGMFGKDIRVWTVTGDSSRLVPERIGSKMLLRGKQIMILFILYLKFMF